MLVVFFHPQDGHTDFLKKKKFFFCSSSCVTSEALQYQRKSHMVSYFIHSSSSVFFCLPPTQRSLCCFHSLPTYLSSPLSFLALFMMGTPPPPVSGAEVFKENSALTLSSYALRLLPAGLPLPSSFTNK